jgi:signal peptidase I
MRFVREAADWAAQAVVLLFATSTIAMPYVIPSGSMESTLMTGDHVIVDKLAYAPHNDPLSRLLPYSDVKHGDIIVFRYPRDIRQTFVKRVIGVPGDRIHLENGVVVRNGVRLVEPYVQHIATAPDAYRDNFPNSPGQEVLVPPGRYFVMGDNRDNSSDSRYWGFVPRENITGKPLLVFWSYDAPEEDLLEYNAHHMVDLAAHFFTKTRWSRTMRLVRPE